jgi:hypothetical protein
MYLYKRFVFKDTKKETMYVVSYDSEDKPELYRKTYWWDWKVWELKLYKLRITKYINRYGCRFFENV